MQVAYVILSEFLRNASYPCEADENLSRVSFNPFQRKYPDTFFLSET